MKTVFVLLFTVVLAGACVGCAYAPSAEHLSLADRHSAGRLTLTGSSTVAPLVAEIAKRFEQRRPGVRIDVQTGGTGKGITDTRLGVADIGMASRRLNADETDLTVHPIATDGVGLIVHRSNRIEELSPEQIMAIYTDQVNNWRDVGGDDREITVVHKAEGRATLEVFLAHFNIDNTTVKADVLVGENEHAIKTVVGAVGAIGYVSIGTAEAAIAGGVRIRLLPLGGVAANTANVAGGEFPMSRPLNLVTTASPPPLAVEFVRFCRSADVHDLIRAHYFVPPASDPDAAN